MRTVVSALAAIALSACVTNYVPRTVTDKVYRSAQLSPARLEAVIEQYGIKSIVNLRGPAPGERWYERELQVAQRNGVSVFSYGLSARRWPEPQTLHALVTTIHSAPRPLLLHCRGGSNRTGLVSTLLVLDRKGRRDGHLGIRYGHLSWWQDLGVMDEVVEAYEAARDRTGVDLFTWVEKEYPARYAARDRNR